MTERFHIQTLVIGAGVVGLAVARKLAMQGREVWLLERESEFGSQTSSRNSEVIHAGIYYPKDSLKAKLCVQGKYALYDYCERHNIPYSRCGKLIVANSKEQIATLKSIQAKAIQNGVDDLRFVEHEELMALEPELSGLAALLSPSTGMLDSHAFMQQLLADFENAGGHCVFQSEVKARFVSKEEKRFEIVGQDTELTADVCVNAAGLQAPGFFERIDGFPQHCLPKPFFAKGSYFSYSGKAPFTHLIYPVPEVGGLGIHLTIDLAGQAKFGPDVEWLNVETSLQEFDYQVEGNRKDKFLEAIQRYWPGIEENKLVPDYSGIRPKLSGPGDEAADFVLQDEREHGVQGLINLFGIESPGLTASLAIADAVVDRLINETG